MINDYRPIARANEAIFRNVLRDMRSNRRKRPMGAFIPEDLETEAPIEALFDKYSAGRRYGKFTIRNFKRPTDDSASISFEDIACLSGGGAELEYLVKPDHTVEFLRPGTVIMS